MMRALTIAVLALGVSTGLASLTAGQNVVISGEPPSVRELREMPTGSGLVLGRALDAMAVARGFTSEECRPRTWDEVARRLLDQLEQHVTLPPLPAHEVSSSLEDGIVVLGVGESGQPSGGSPTARHVGRHAQRK